MYELSDAEVISTMLGRALNTLVKLQKLANAGPGKRTEVTEAQIFEVIIQIKEVTKRLGYVTYYEEE